ncbi:hypothetical protein H5410_022563, partial [Solanum commersonii]
VFELRDKTWTLWRKRNKAAERAKKRRPENRLNHWVSRRMALVSPNVLYLNLGTKHGHYGAKRNKAAERAKKRRPEDRLNHWASRRMALVSPNAPVCLALKEKIKLAMKGSSQRVIEQLRKVAPHRPMIQNREDVERKS